MDLVQEMNALQLVIKDMQRDIDMLKRTIVVPDSGQKQTPAQPQLQRDVAQLQKSTCKLEKGSYALLSVKKLFHRDKDGSK